VSINGARKACFLCRWERSVQGGSGDKVGKLAGNVNFATNTSAEKQKKIGLGDFNVCINM
jgi:hypothetical protein